MSSTLTVSKGEVRIFDLVRSEFAESCGYLQCLLGDRILYISLIILEGIIFHDLD